MESDKYTEAVLRWRQPQTIQQVVVKAEPGQLEFFAVQYMNDAERVGYHKRGSGQYASCVQVHLEGSDCDDQVSAQGAAPLGLASRRWGETFNPW